MNNILKHTTMKKIIVILIFCLSGTLAYSQQDTLHWNENEPTYYYWDSLWWNWHVIKYYETHPDSMRFWAGAWHLGNGYGRNEYARPFETDTALKIIGVAAPVRIGESSDNTADTSLANRVTEYFRLFKYDDGQMVKLAEAPWTTPSSNIRHAMATGHDYNFIINSDTFPHLQYYELDENIYPVYEAYFPDPVIVTGSFFISGTQYNNFEYCDTTYEEWHIMDTVIINRDINCIRAHRTTAYIVSYLMGDLSAEDISTYPSVYQYPPYYLERSHSDDKDPDDPSSDGSTWERVNCRKYLGFINLFPIIDTGFSCSSLVSMDSCTAPENLHITLNQHRTVTVAWDHISFDGSWDMLSLKESDSAASATITTHNIPFASFSSDDTNSWFVAKVRTICDSSYSDWSDTIRFRVKGGLTVEYPESIESLVDELTYIMPNPASEKVTVSSSFGILRIGLYSVSGKTVVEKEVKALSTDLDISSCPPGFYIVRIQTNRGIVSKRLVID